MGRKEKSSSWLSFSVVCSALLVGALVFEAVSLHSRSPEAREVLTGRPGRRLAAYLTEPGFYSARTLAFSVCNGFANQRLAIAYGIIIAHHLGRAAVLPEVLMNGTQASDEWTLGELNSTQPFSSMYDSQHLVDSLKQEGIVAIEPADAPPPERYSFISLKLAPPNPLEWLREQGRDATHLQIDCPFLRLPPDTVKANRKHFWTVMEALRPSLRLENYVKDGVSKLKAMSANSTAYNFLHLRLENDWLGHCKRWGSIPDGQVRNNCFNNTFTLDTLLQGKGVSNKEMLYVASSWPEANTEIVQKVMSKLVLGGYQIATQKLLFQTDDLSREEAACVEYYIAMESSRFLGNSVSSYSAMIILERQRKGSWAAYYNSGNIPMSAAVPLYKLPWVFTYNSWSTKYDYMLKAAVKSGLVSDTMIPYCLFSGDQSSMIAQWLQETGVTMIYAEPQWLDQLLKGLKKANNSEYSHLYADPQMQIGTWQRIDIPILPELSQWEYVLFTDADVYFRRPITLDSFSLPLPKTFGMASEMNDIFPYNAGIMLMHLPPLQATYNDFLEFIFKNENGMYFPGYGPGDQGAINQFYENSVIGSKLSQDFNAKPYFPFQDSSSIVHFHGPKPADMLDFLETGQCAFGELCERNAQGSFCVYALEWASFIPDEVIASRLSSACKLLSQVSDLQTMLDSHVASVTSRL